MKRILTFLSLLFLFSFTDNISADVVVFNTRIDGAIGSFSFTAGDFVQYDLTTNEASVFFPSGNFASVNNGEINPDAISVRKDGSFLLSSRRPMELAGLVFNQLRLVNYEPTSGVATTAFAGVGGFDISGVDILDNGNYLLAAKSPNTSLGGHDYSIGDIVEYNPVTNEASTFFSADNFLSPEEGGPAQPANIDAVDLYNGSLLFSTSNGADIKTPSGGALRVRQESVYAFDLATGETSLFFDGGSVFTSNSVDIKSFSVISTDLEPVTTIPEPSSSLIGVLGALAFGYQRNRRLFT